MGARRVITLRHIYVCARDTDKVKGADPEIEKWQRKGLYTMLPQENFTIYII